MFDLSTVSNMIADHALQLGGSDIRWHKAMFCPNVRDDGTPCYDETRGSSWKECPVCGGRGTMYASPITIKGVYTDNSNQWFPDGAGGVIKGNKSLTLPRHLDIRLLKDRDGDSRRLLRDKFELLGKCCDHNGQRPVAEVLYLLHDPVRPTIHNDTILMTVEVGNNY